MATIQYETDVAETNASAYAKATPRTPATPPVTPPPVAPTPVQPPVTPHVTPPTNATPTPPKTGIPVDPDTGITTVVVNNKPTPPAPTIPPAVPPVMTNAPEPESAQHRNDITSAGTAMLNTGAQSVLNGSKAGMNSYVGGVAGVGVSHGSNTAAGGINAGVLYQSQTGKFVGASAVGAGYRSTESNGAILGANAIAGHKNANGTAIGVEAGFVRATGATTGEGFTEAKQRFNSGMFLNKTFSNNTSVNVGTGYQHEKMANGETHGSAYGNVGINKRNENGVTFGVQGTINNLGGGAALSVGKNTHHDNTVVPQTNFAPKFEEVTVVEKQAPAKPIFTASMSSDEFFAFDKHTIRRDKEPLYMQQAKALLEKGALENGRSIVEEALATGSKIRITGHTDAFGSDNYNLGLSQKRAQAVRDAYVKAGIPAELIEMSGVGEKAVTYSNEDIAKMLTTTPRNKVKETTAVDRKTVVELVSGNPKAFQMTEEQKNSLEAKLTAGGAKTRVNEIGTRQETPSVSAKTETHFVGVEKVSDRKQDEPKMESVFENAANKITGFGNKLVESLKAGMDAQQTSLEVEKHNKLLHNQPQGMSNKM